MRPASAALLFLAVHLVVAFSNLTKNGPNAVEQKQAHDYYMCVARCGENFGYGKNVTLASGEPVLEWQLDDDGFDKCKIGCEFGTHFDPRTRTPTHSSLTPDFGKLEVICVDRLSVTPPRVRVKLAVPTSALSPPAENVTLYVIEVFSATVNEAGGVDTELVQRNFSFSPRFIMQHTFSGATPKRELVTFRVHAFSQHHEVGQPLCSDDIILQNVYGARRHPISIALNEKVTMKESSMVLLTWDTSDSRFPPECEQFVHWTSGGRPNNKLVNLDSSHTIVVSDLNETQTYVITAYGRSEEGQNQRSPAKLVIRLNPEAHELIREEIVQFMDSYAIAVAGAVVIILVGLLTICFCMQYKASVRRREKKSKKKYALSTLHVGIGNPVKTSTPNRDEASKHSFAVNTPDFFPAANHIYTQRLPHKSFAAPNPPQILSLTPSPFEKDGTLC